MNRPLLFLAFVTTTFAARADLIIEQAIQSPMQNGKLTLKVKGDRVRVDLPSGQVGGMSMIVDGKSGDTLTLIHGQKMAMKVSGERTKQMMEMMRASRNKASQESAPGKLEDTGKSEKIGEYQAELYTFTTDAGTQKLWVAKDFPNYAQFKGELEALNKTSARGAAEGMTPDLSALPGMVVKTESDMGGQKVVSTLVSLKQEKVEDTVFDLPADYKEMAAPKMPGAPAGK